MMESPPTVTPNIHRDKFQSLGIGILNTEY
jgi:hypothetical protein